MIRTLSIWHQPFAYLFRQLLLAEFVEEVEFDGKLYAPNKTASYQLHTNDDLTVWHHHGHGSEVDLQIFWQLLTSSITRILQKIYGK